uniref:Uncharacterized protein n=1 Tax=Sus scrofa TaxID=9823 RepID=A0A8D0N5P4_PIG
MPRKYQHLAGSYSPDSSPSLGTSTCHRCSPKKRGGKKTKQNPGQNQKGGFHSSFHKLFAKKSNGSEHKEKTNENSPVDPLHTHTISLETDLLFTWEKGTEDFSWHYRKTYIWRKITLVRTTEKEKHV